MSAATSIPAPKFPARVWSHPLLAALDARARTELESAGGVRVLADGDKLFGAGDPADALFVVITGAIALRSGARRAELRRAAAWDVVGEEAAARSHATRRHDATAVGRTELAVVPAALLRRVMARGEETDAGRRTQRWLVRALASDTLERADFARDLPPRAREMMLDAGRPIELRRGDTLHRDGDESGEAYFLAEGIIQIATEADHARVLAYHKAGDFFGDEAIEGETRDATATATSDAWIFAVRADVVRELALAHPDARARAMRVQTAARDRQREIRENATRHVLADLHRFETSRSLLAIDQEQCIRCGHCAWSCAESHDDGISRLLRRGDVVVAKVRGEAKTLLLPSSCQHCKNPACMIDCPTGAITRDADGEVHIREELCTGCGSCAKACPWDNIQMAPRGDAKRSLPIVRTESPAVAVKCDLCHGRDGGPACVSACPVSAIVRIDPSVDLDEVRAVLDPKAGGFGADAARVAPKRSGRAQSLLVPASLIAAAGVGAGAFEALEGASRFASGVVLLVMVLALVGYAAVKRLGLRIRGRASKLARVRPHFVVHLGVGVAALGVAAAHARGHSPLAISFWAVAGLGMLAGLVGFLAPKRLARIERSALLPEELGERIREQDARVFRDLSGKSDLLKGLYARVLRPFSRSILVLAHVCVTGPSQRATRARLRAKVDALVGEPDERLDGLDGLVAIAVERQALRAQRVLTRLLRATSFAHVVAAAGLVVIVALHVAAELAR